MFLSKEILYTMLVHLKLLLSNNLIFMKLSNLELFSQEYQKSNFSKEE